LYRSYFKGISANIALQVYSVTLTVHIAYILPPKISRGIPDILRRPQVYQMTKLPSDRSLPKICMLLIFSRLLDIHKIVIHARKIKSNHNSNSIFANMGKFKTIYIISQYSYIKTPLCVQNVYIKIANTIRTQERNTLFHYSV
jgi:hypothetical protein